MSRIRTSLETQTLKEPIHVAWASEANGGDVERQRENGWSYLDCDDHDLEAPLEGR